MPNAPETITKEGMFIKSFNVDHRLLDIELIEAAITTVCKNKHKRNGKQTRKYKLSRRILNNKEAYAKEIRSMLEGYLASKLASAGEVNVVCGSAFSPSEPFFFKKRCESNGKIRDIACVPLFPDQIIHQVIVLAAQPVFMRGMYRFSCGSVPGRGVHDGAKYLKRRIKSCAKRNRPDIKYVAQLDIKKCYPHVSHDALKTALSKKFRGRLFLWLCFDIIDSYNCADPGELARGIPIGFYTSQWFLNFLLTPLDHYVVEDLHVKTYIRYVDDMVFMGRNKKVLHNAVRLINEKISYYGLQIKENWSVYRFDYIDKDTGRRRGRFIDVLGYRFYRDKTTQRRRNSLRLRSGAKRILYMYKHHKRITARMARAFISRLGAIRHCNSKRYYMEYIKPFVKVRKLKEVIAREGREYCPAA